ncbi:MAG TPA: hypothetical protein VLV86_02610 [Vicinamibacterales bacterium]|nr:hypothetical protein [Vicinamibacterales bacterium]
MKARVAMLVGVTCAAAASAIVSPQAQSATAAKVASAPSPVAKAYTAKTPWGDPDLQGVWDYKTITPLERPANFGDRQFLTDDEVSRLEANAARRLDAPPDQDTPVGLVHAPYMTDPGRKVDEDRRTSLIVDPPDGRIPPLTAAAQSRLALRRVGDRNGGTDGPEQRSSLERCITWGLPTAILPGLYNNNIRIVQGPGYVTITHEMVHDTRIVPLDGRPALSAKMHQWFGDSRGHWEGSTLVVETQNFSDKTNYRGSGAGLHMLERFTRTGKNTVEYRLTVDDPSTWIRSWTIEEHMRTSEGDLYEYACHEGNYGMHNILEEARDADKAAAKNTGKSGVSE